MSGTGPRSNAPDSAQPILGWRVWRLDEDALLRPLVVGSPWVRGTNEARCQIKETRHRAPGRGCVCGFNALHEVPREFLGDGGHAVGAIAAWGTVDVYRTGLRAERACVLGLLDLPASGEVHAERLQRAAAFYGVPLLPLDELTRHVERLAGSAAETLAPGINRRPPVPQRPAQPLPAGALPQAGVGDGVQIHTHLAIEHRRRNMRVGPTPSLAALCSDQVEPVVGAGEIVAEGDPLFAAYAGRCVTVGPAPAAGVVLAVHDDVPRFEAGPRRGGWLVELRLEAESLDGSSIAWGRRGAEAYREHVLASGSDADLLLTCAENPAPAETLLDPDEGRAWLRAFAQRLDTGVREDTALRVALSSMAGAGAVRFEVEGVETLRIAPPAVGSDRWVTSTGPAPEEAGRGAEEIRIRLRPDSLRRYWRGELGLAPDDVSVSEPGAAGHEYLAPLHLLSGDRGRLLLANSLHKRLFGAATAILDDLGNPWFKAGDAIRDPVANLEALCGFQRADGELGDAA
ncbi:MAG TPA: hypothetical protein VKA36_05070 [Solirubrobacterales bacterium]|nr:hypothetical protein [Solirubrobacterales bacterium]